MSSVGTMGVWSAPVVVTSVLLFNLAVKLVEMLYPVLFPNAYKQLSTNASAVKIRYLCCYIVSYFVLFAIQVPACYLALRSPSTTENGGGSLFGPGEVCVGSRALIWASEMHYLPHSHSLWLHHFFALVSMVLMVATDCPLRQLYAIYLSLVNEAFGKLGITLALHGLDRTRPQVLARLRVAHVVGIWVIRIPAIIWAACDTLLHTNGQWPLAAGWAYFGSYTLYLAWRLGEKQGLYGVTKTRPAHLRIGNMHWTIFEVVFKASLALVMLSTSSLYSLRGAVYHRTQAGSTAWLGSLLVIYIGLRSAAWACEYLHGKHVLASNHRQYWFEGGLSITSVLAYAMARFGPADVDSTSFLAALAMSVLLLEAGVHIGCCFEASSIRIRERSRSINATHVLTSFAASVTYGVLLKLLVQQRITLGEAGAVAMATRGLIRLLLYTFEYRVSAYLLLVHTVVSVLSLAQLYVINADRSGRPRVYLLPGLVSVVLVVTVTYSSQVKACRQAARWLVRPLHIAILAGIAVIIGCVYNATMAKSPEAVVGDWAANLNETSPHRFMDDIPFETTGGSFVHNAAVLTVLAGALLMPSSFLTRVNMQAEVAKAK